MKILFLHSSSDLYGASKVLLEIVDVCKNAEHTPIVIVSAEDLLTNVLKERNIDYRIISLGVIRRKYLTPIGVFNRYMLMIKASKKIISIINQEKVQLLYTNTSPVWVAAFIYRKLKIKHYWHIHEIIDKPYFMHKITGFILKKYCTKIIAVSNAVKESWIDVIKPDKIKVIYNGFDFSSWNNAHPVLREELNLPSSTILMGIIGRINLIKGQKYFIEIASKIITEFSNVHFIIVGDTTKGFEYLEAEMNNHIAEFKLEKYFSVLGYRNDIANILKSIDIFMLTSQKPDSFPTTVLEAMAAAKPVVATEQGGAVEMIDNNKTGIFIPLNNPTKASQLITPLIANKTLREHMGLAGNERLALLFSKEKFNNEIKKLFECD